MRDAAAPSAGDSWDLFQLHGNEFVQNNVVTKQVNLQTHHRHMEVLR